MSKGEIHMVTNFFIQCNFCKAIYRLRWQIGHEKATVQIRCPKCNSRIHGYLSTNESSIINIHGAKEVSCDNADYVQEISTEFLTHKIKAVAEFDDFITPFIRSNIYDHQNIMEYLHFIENHPNEFEVINDLLNEKSSKYLKEKLRDDNNIYINICKRAIKKYRLNSQVDLLMASHQYLMTMLLRSGVDSSVASVMNDIKDLRIKYYEQVKEFSKLLDNKGYYALLNSKFSKLTNIYNENYLSFVSTLITDDISKIDLDEFGLSSVDYEDLLELYRKCYEFIGEFIIYIVGLNNIYERGDYNSFKNGIADIEEKVNKEDKYNRIQSFVKKGEKFSNGFCETLNKIIRNAEAHFDVQYDIFKQIITFTNKGKNKTDEEKLYLLEFAKETINIFGLCVLLWEIAYQLQKTRLILDLRQDWNYGKN